MGLIRANRRVRFWPWLWCLVLVALLALPSFGASLLLPLLWLEQHRRTRWQIEEWALDLREI
ncbi:MAG: hypothetical protein ACKOZT_07390 [Cyanobium sp.]